MDLPPNGRLLVEIIHELLRAAGAGDVQVLQRPQRSAEDYDQRTRGALLAVAPLFEELKRETAVITALDRNSFAPVRIPGAFWRYEAWRITFDPPAIGRRQRLRVESEHGRGPNAYRWKTEWIYVEPRLTSPAATDEAPPELGYNEKSDAAIKGIARHRNELEKLKTQDARIKFLAPKVGVSRSTARDALVAWWARRDDIKI